MRTSSHPLVVLTVGIVIFGCSATDTTGVPGGGVGGESSFGGTTSGVGGAPATGGVVNNGTTAQTGGTPATGGTMATGGIAATGGRATGGTPPATGGSKAATGGSPPTGTGGMMPATGGSVPTATGGMGPATGGSKAGTGGKAAGGNTTIGGNTAMGGSTGIGGKAATGGSSAAAGGAVSCSGTMPSGGTQHCSTYQEGTSAGLSWQVWSNGSAGCITTYSTPAFSATWNNNGDFIGRIGLQWNDTKTYDQYGTISAQYSYTKTGSGGGYSYIGIYGWSTNPCVEYYIIDDSFGSFPFNAYGMTQKGTATIDGESYKLFAGTTKGTGGSRCGSATSWNQYWSVRQKARQCGTISITQHFDAWKAAGMAMGKMDEAQLLVEVGGGSGSVNFSTANVTTTQ